MEIIRTLILQPLLKKKSLFLFGPRATGKSHLIREQLSDSSVVLDLLRSELFLRFSAAPQELESVIDGELAKRRKPQKSPYIVIDEIQRCPLLLNEVHRLIENRRLTFLLTGSSARKLRRGQSNLLAGRAWRADLFPLSWVELENQFDLDRMLRFGGLPAVYLSQDPHEDLDAYVQTYLVEEIQAEGLVRKLPAFSRFLTVAALQHGQLLNFANVSNDAQISASTVRDYFSILEDTLLGFLLEPWTKSRKRKAIATAKFYFFDTGVVHTLARTKVLERNSDLYGRSFEQWIAMELRAALSYQRRKEPLCYWRSTHGHEVDFVIGDDIAIEVKATTRATPRDARGLRALQEEGFVKRGYLVSQDNTESIVDGIHFLHWETFMRKLWGGEVWEP